MSQEKRGLEGRLLLSGPITLNRLLQIFLDSFSVDNKFGLFFTGVA